jgi:DNA-binding NtrC family response regulator
MTISNSVSTFSAPLHFPEPKNASEFEILGDGEAMRRVRLQVQRIGPHFRTVLVRGEIGTGKELVARALHSVSVGSEGPLVVCHAASFEDVVAEGTGDEWLNSMICAAERGTFFIDGIEGVPAAAQAQLADVLRKKLALRVIASTTADLRGLVSEGAFLYGLFHRIAAVEIVVPPLRQRVEDLPLLTAEFLERFSKLYGRRVPLIAEDAMERMMAHGWPGNVRELENTIRNGLLQCDGSMLRAHDLTSLLEIKGETASAGSNQPTRLQDVIDRHVLHVLRVCGGNKMKAAEVLGISRSTLYRMLEAKLLRS